jgi:hypothetical protein
LGNSGRTPIDDVDRLGIMFEAMLNTPELLGEEMLRLTVLMMLPASTAVAVKYASVFPDVPASFAPTSSARPRKRSRRVRRLKRIRLRTRACVL